MKTHIRIFVQSTSQNGTDFAKQLEKEQEAIYAEFGQIPLIQFTSSADGRITAHFQFHTSPPTVIPSGNKLFLAEITPQIITFSKYTRLVEAKDSSEAREIAKLLDPTATINITETLKYNFTKHEH